MFTAVVPDAPSPEPPLYGHDAGGSVHGIVLKADATCA
jgi:hypothetical protein